MYVTSYKKGDIEEPNNCRPFSITSALSKIFETVLNDIFDPLNYWPILITTPFFEIHEKGLHKYISAYAKNRGILTSLQSGFRSKVSAQNPFLFFIGTIQHEIEIGNIVHSVLLDLSKSFDSILHQIFLEKLQSLHFSPSTIQIV